MLVGKVGGKIPDLSVKTIAMKGNKTNETWWQNFNMNM